MTQVNQSIPSIINNDTMKTQQFHPLLSTRLGSSRSPVRRHRRSKYTLFGSLMLEVRDPILPTVPEDHPLLKPGSSKKCSENHHRRNQGGVVPCLDITDAQIPW